MQTFEQRVAAVAAGNVVQSVEDSRDFAHIYTGQELPTELDLRYLDTPIKNQGGLGSCVAHANVASCEQIAIVNGMTPGSQDWAELFPHYKARELDGLLALPEGGCTPRSGLKAVNKFGVPTEADYPYVEAQYNDNPSSMVHTLAMQNRVSRYERLDIWDYNVSNRTVMAIKRAVAERAPVTLAFACYEPFMRLHGPLATHAAQFAAFEGNGGGNFYGGHQVKASGYSDSLGGILVKNHWTTAWGDGGYGILPYTQAARVYEAWLLRGFKGWTVDQPIDVHNGVSAQVFRLYKGMYLREPDLAGHAYHVASINSGAATISQVANNFTVAPEFTQRYGALDDVQFIVRLYRNIFDRDPSTQEIDYHWRRLTGPLQGQRGAFLLGFSDSPEFIDRLTYYH